MSSDRSVSSPSPFVFLEYGRKQQATAGMLSLGLHAAGLLLIWAIAILIRDGLLPSPALNIHAPVVIDGLIWRPPVTRDAGGGGGGDHALLQASRGAVPLVTVRRPLMLPAIVTNPQARLPVNPAFDAEAPQIQADQYGDPLSQSGLLSMGPGTRGIGAGTLGWGDGSGPGWGSGNGPGKAVYGWNQVTTQPAVLIRVEPEYSEQARQNKFQGTVLLRVVIDEKGTPREIGVSRPLGMGLDEKAMEAVRQWRFRPATKDGKAVAMEAIIQVNFRLL